LNGLALSSARHLLLCIALLVLSTGAATAEGPDSQPQEGKLSLMTLLPDLTPVSNYEGDLWTRPALFGDVAGHRQALLERGVALDFGLTQVPQGVVSGGKKDEWKYGASADYYLFLDSGRLGLWPGGLVGIHAESKFGRSVMPFSGVISPVNADYLWPSPGEESVTFLSEYYIWQGVTEWLMLQAGRVNWTALADRSRFANDEKTQFLNMSLRNTALLGAFVPLTAHGVALALAPRPNVSLALVAVSANDQPDEYGSPGGLFSEVTPAAELDVSWKLGDLPGTARPAFAWTSKDTVAFDNRFLVPDLILGLDLPTKSDNWLVNINFDQYVFMPKKQSVPKLHTAPFDFEPEGVGVFFRFAYTPEDRNPWNMFVSGGVGGRGVIPSRPNDRYGLGFYAMLESNDLKDQPVLGGLLDTEWGMEVFYNVAITPWLQVTPDLQYIQSGLPGVDDSLVLATRVQMYF
jgi:porin